MNQTSSSDNQGTYVQVNGLRMYYSAPWWTVYLPDVGAGHRLSFRELPNHYSRQPRPRPDEQPFGEIQLSLDGCGYCRIHPGTWAANAFCGWVQRWWADRFGNGDELPRLGAGIYDRRNISFHHRCMATIHARLIGEGQTR
jgi:hypothetical protein